MRRPTDFGQLLKRYVKKTIEDTYKEYGYNGIANVEVVFQSSITIRLDTENPYMDVEFWEFLGEIAKKLEGVLKLSGYTYSGTNYYYSFCYIHYEFTAFDGFDGNEKETDK